MDSWPVDAKVRNYGLAFWADKRTARVKVATRAQTKLLHIVLMLKTWLISCKRCHQSYCAILDAHTSIENKTPPMGDPNATATPAALAAVTISRILPAENFRSYQFEEHAHTLTTRKLLEKSGNKISNTTCNMHSWAFLSNR
jgi:hypothetical protein